MYLRYMNGTVGQDDWFDKDLEIRRYLVARAMDLPPNDQAPWPIKQIDDLLAIRRHEGPERFYEEIRRMCTPPQSVR